MTTGQSVLPTYAAYLQNHDDTTREYAYEPYYNKADSTWSETMKEYCWTQVNMATEFKTIWMQKY